MIKLNMDGTSVIVSDYRDTLVANIPENINSSTVISKEKYHRGYKISFNGHTFWNVSEIRWNGLPEDAPRIEESSPTALLQNRINTGKVIE